MSLTQASRIKRPNSNSDVPDDKKFKAMENNKQQTEDKGGKEETQEDEVLEGKDMMKVLLQKMKNLDCLPAMKDNLSQITQDIAGIKSSLEYTQKEVQELKEKYEQQEDKISVLQKKVTEIDSLREENRELRNQITALEGYGRRENLVFDNIPEKQGEVCSDVVRGLFKKLGLADADTIMLQRVHRLGSYSTDATSTRNRPIIVRFAFFPDRERVWRSRSKLAGTRITMREDFPEPIERERRILVPILRAAKKLENVKSRLVANKLIVNSQTFTVNTLNHLPAPLAPRKVSEKVVSSANGGVYHLFEGRLSPFSNFHPSHFKLNGLSFSCAEQYYSYQKAIFANRPDVAQAILKENDPVKMKRLDRQMAVNHKMWMSERGKQVMREALDAKFRQNHHLRDILLATRDSTLVECNRFDKVWGIGLGMDSEEACDCTTWKGDNLLGFLLGQVRDNL